MATHQRHRLSEMGFDVSDPILCVHKDPSVVFKLSQTAVGFQKQDQLLAAAGLMVWIHTLRAVVRSELRVDARELWRHLSRGFPYVADGAHAIELLTGTPVATDDAVMFPQGFAPDPE